MLEQTPAGISVFSTHVEVILADELARISPNSILHACGGDPGSKCLSHSEQTYSPRMWR